MPDRKTAKDYNSLAKFFHWGILALLLFQFGSILTAQIALKSGPGFIPFGYKMMGLHKAVGLTIFIVAGFRLLWRHISGLPQWAPGLANWEKTASHKIENWLYGLLFFVPLSGLIYSISSGIPTDFFGVFTIPALSTKHMWASNTAYFTHMISIYLFIVALTLHLGLVLRRSIFEKDQLIQRMLPGKLKG